MKNSGHWYTANLVCLVISAQANNIYLNTAKLKVIYRVKKEHRPPYSMGDFILGSGCSKMDLGVTMHDQLNMIPQCDPGQKS